MELVPIRTYGNNEQNRETHRSTSEIELEDNIMIIGLGSIAIILGTPFLRKN